MERAGIEDSKTLRWMITLADIVVMLACLLGSYFFYEATDKIVNQGVDLQIYLVVALLTFAPVTYLLPIQLLERTVRGDKVVGRASQTVLLHFVFFLTVLFLLKKVAIARTLLVTFGLLFWVVLVLERLTFLSLIRRFRSSGRNKQHVVFVGYSEELEELNEYMSNREMGFDVVGIFTDGSESLGNVPVLGGTDGVLSYLQENTHVNAVYCTMAQVQRQHLTELYRYCENNLVRFYALPVNLSYLRRSMKVNHFGSTILLSPRREPLQDPGNHIVKRLFDLIFSGLFLLTIFPLIYIIVAIIIKRQSRGPVIFVQRRTGMNGQDFNCYKFRSMHINATSDVAQATEQDPRKFPFGDWIRRTSIDELPQFVNVFLGNMSIVGPRPHMLHHTEEYGHIINKYMVRHWVKPGITGWAQVNGLRGETRETEMMEKRVKADIWYIENWTFWLDVRIIWRTVKNMLFHRDEQAY